MTISSSLNAGVAGLASNASRLATISDNIANSSTFGYKRAVTDFSSMVVNSGSDATYTAGGVRITSERLIDERGSLVSTSNGTDLAVSGLGMLPVSDGSLLSSGNTDVSLQMATTGSFRQDADGYLTTSSDLVLLGWPANADGSIPSFPRDTATGLEPIQLSGSQFISDPTTAIDMIVNLPATGTQAGASGDSEVLSVEYFDTLGIAQNLAVSFAPDVPATGGPATNTWTMLISDDATGGTLIGQYTLVFDDDPGLGGRLESVSNTIGGAYVGADGTFSVSTDSGDIDISIGLIGETGGMTQLSDSFAPVSLSKDGSPVGNLTTVEIDDNGDVYAFYDNGLSRALYRIPLVYVPNVNGLDTEDHQSYTVSLDSGEFYLWDAGDGPTGSVVRFAREESATDVANELTQLIQTQRAYSSNAKVIQTVDEMLQETTNIKR